MVYSMNLPVHEASPGLLTGAWVVFRADSDILRITVGINANAM
jgi:hypothetical protein